MTRRTVYRRVGHAWHDSRLRGAAGVRQVIHRPGDREEDPELRRHARGERAGGGEGLRGRRQG